MKRNDLKDTENKPKPILTVITNRAGTRCVVMYGDYTLEDRIKEEDPDYSYIFVKYKGNIETYFRTPLKLAVDLMIKLAQQLFKGERI